MTDQRPTSEPEEPTGPPTPVEWVPDDTPTMGGSNSETVARPGGLAQPEYVPTTFAEAAARMQREGEAEIRGSLFPVVEKEQMLKVPFIICDFQWTTDPETKQEYVSLHVIDKENERHTINDGGTGIFKQMKQWEHDMPERKTMIDCPNGLRKSAYIAKYKGVNKETGEIEDMTSPATTYYIA